MSKNIRAEIEAPTHVLVTDGTATDSNVGYTPVEDGLFLPSTIDATVLVRSGNAATLGAIVLGNGELAVETNGSNRYLWVGDGSTLGGIQMLPRYGPLLSGSAYIAGNLTGNARGSNAMDFQSSRSSSSMVASGADAVAYGSNCTASGSQSIAVGSGATASAQRSIALGFNSSAIGLRSTSVGPQGTAEGSFSTVIGFACNTGVDAANALAAGYGCSVTGESSYAFGREVSITTPNTMEFGLWPDAVRAGAFRMDDSGIFQITIRNSASAPTDGGANAGSESSGTLGRGLFCIQRNGLAFRLYYNDAGTVKSILLGTAS